MNGKQRFFTLLQINDAAFPIGSYTHSYGLETYIQKGLVQDSESAGLYIRHNVLHAFLYSELLAVKLAFAAAEQADLEELRELEEISYAARTPMEIRQAAGKLGTRFAKMADIFPDCDTIFQDYQDYVGKKNISHAVCYGVFCAAAGIEAEEAISAYLYAQVSAMVTNCVKTIPISQTDGQRLLAGYGDLYEEAEKRLQHLSKDDLCRSAPGLDIRAMQHEHLYSRLYMS